MSPFHESEVKPHSEKKKKKKKKVKREKKKRKKEKGKKKKEKNIYYSDRNYIQFFLNKRSWWHIYTNGGAHRIMVIVIRSELEYPSSNSDMAVCIDILEKHIH